MAHQCDCPVCAERGEAIDIAYDHLLSCGYKPDGMVLSLLAHHLSNNREAALERALMKSLEELRDKAVRLEGILRDEPKPWWAWWRR